MKNQETNIAQEGNLYSDYDPSKGYAQISNSMIEDPRLDFGDFYLLCKLIKLSKTKFHLSQRLSAKYFRMSPKTFSIHLNNLIELGYIYRIKNKYNYTYRINNAEYIEKLVFDYSKMKAGFYSRNDLEKFYQSNDVDPRWKAIIKRYIDGTQEAFSKAQKEITEREQNDDDLPF